MSRGSVSVLMGLALAAALGSAEPDPAVLTELVTLAGEAGLVRPNQDITHVATVQEIDGRHYVYRHAQQLGGPYDKATWLRWSPDESSLVWSACNHGRWSVYRDGIRVGGEYEMAGEAQVSPDGQHVAFRAKNKGKWFIVRDGEQLGRQWPMMGEVVFNHDWSSWACVVSVPKGGFIIRDDVRFAGPVAACSLRFRPQSNDLAYFMCLGPSPREKKHYVAINGAAVDQGHAFIPHPEIRWRGQTVKYPAWDEDRWQIYLGGEPQGAGWPGSRRPCVISPDEQHAITEEEHAGRWRALLDGEPVTQPHVGIGRVLWSADSRSCAITAFDGESFADRQIWLYKGGAVIDGPCKRIRIRAFRPDGSSLVWTRLKLGEPGEPQEIVRDGTVIASDVNGVTDSQPTPTGLISTAVRGRKVYRVEITW